MYITKTQSQWLCVFCLKYKLNIQYLKVKMNILHCDFKFSLQ